MLHNPCSFLMFIYQWEPVKFSNALVNVWLCFEPQTDSKNPAFLQYDDVFCTVGCPCRIFDCQIGMMLLTQSSVGYLPSIYPSAVWILKFWIAQINECLEAKINKYINSFFEISNTTVIFITWCMFVSLERQKKTIQPGLMGMCNNFILWSGYECEFYKKLLEEKQLYRSPSTNLTPQPNHPWH